MCKCNDSRGVSCSVWQRSSHVAVVFRLLSHRFVLTMINREMKYLWQATQIYTFVTRGLLHICFCRHTHTHTIKFAIAIIMHINKSTAEEDVSVYKNKHRSTRKHYITNIAKTNSSVNLSVSLPLSDPQINHHILILHKEHFSSSVFFFFFFFLQAAWIRTGDETLYHPL